MIKKSIEERFWDKIDKNGPIHPICGQCWVWKAGLSSNGYGQFSAYGEKSAHRASYLMHFGKIPEGLFILHKCDNKSCVNPNHLIAGTPKQNSEDMVNKNRQSKGDNHYSRMSPEKMSRGDRHYSATNPEKVARGEENGYSKLTNTDIPEIRKRLANGESQRLISESYNVNQTTISRIKLNRYWIHIE